MKKELRILVVEDVTADVTLMSHELRSGGLAFEAKRVETREEFLREIEHHPPDVILSDHGLPGFDGFTALALARERCPETPFIFVTGSMGEELAIDSLRSGAADYVLKTRISNLVPAVQRALRLAEERLRRRQAEKELRESEERFRRLRKQQEETLRQSEERYRQLVDLYPDALMVLHDGQVGCVNQAALKLLGADRPEQLIGRPFLNFVPPGAREAIIPRLQAAAKPGAGWKDAVGDGFIEEHLLRMDGSEITVEMTARSLRFEDEPALQIILHDVTGQRTAATALWESEARKTAILETALDAIISIDREGKITEWNPAAERIFGYSRELALGRDLTGLIVPKSNEDLHKKGFARFLQAGRGRMLGHRTELLALRANGAEFPVELTVTKIAGDGPSVFTSFIRDITERRRTEEALRKSEERFRLLVEGVEDYAIYMLDTHGRITTWNAGAQRIMGFRAREIVGRRFHRFYTADDLARKKPDQALAVATADGRFQEERWQVRKDGSQYWASFVITALRDERGRLTGFSTIARDVTKRKQAEDEIHRLNAELERRVEARTAELQAAYQEMEAFSYSISHDLRAPLIHIAGFVEMLKSDLGSRLDEKSARHLQTICDSTESMGRMIADLLTFSRIGRADMHKVRFSLSDTVREVRRDLQSQKQNRKVTWIVPELPEVRGDPFLLRQALYNLLANALKYTRHRAEARIEITVESTDKEHIFAIKDNGAGFDMRYAAKLFGVFQRLHSREEFEGTGIGLANVRRIVGRHGGRTWAEGVVDGGATFYFSLPIATDGNT